MLNQLAFSTNERKETAELPVEKDKEVKNDLITIIKSARKENTNRRQSVPIITKIAYIH